MRKLGLTPLVATLFFHFAAPPASAERSVLLLLFDGLSPAIVSANDTPSLDRLAREGVATHTMEAAFPTISLINGVTISTGCWPERHGIVTNLFLDPERGVYDHSRDADWLLACEHLHVAAQRQGVPAAAVGWYGASSTSRGELARHVSSDPPNCREAAVTDPERVQEIRRLLAMPPERRPRLVLGYFCRPDGAQHFEGIDSDEARADLAWADGAIGELVAAVEALPDASDWSVVVTTDHGMRPVSKMVNVARVLAARDIEARALSTGSTSFLYFEGGDEATIAQAAQKLRGHEAFDVHRKGALPAYAHLGTGPRVGDLVLSAVPPYVIEDPTVWPAWLRWLAPYLPETVPTGPLLRASHGYAPSLPGMGSLFYAWGAGIAAGASPDPIRAIDVHPTVTRLLGIEPGRPVDGAAVEAILSAP